MSKIAVGILGCTGMVGQKFISLLDSHPLFEVTEIIASETSAGKNYAEQVNWKEPTPIPEKVRKLPIKPSKAHLTAKILFSALDAKVAGEIEEFYAKQGHVVISNSKNHRLDKYVPLIIPEINAEHFALIKEQKLNYQRQGFIITNSNCCAIPLTIALAPIYREFGLEAILVTTMQAISGAGYPGVPSLDILGNVIPHIASEEEKIQIEPLKMLGKYENGEIKYADFKISAMCNRVPVLNGHTLAVSFKTKKSTNPKELLEAWTNFKTLHLPSSPIKLINYFTDIARPQPALDVNIGDGMSVSVGNLRPCEVLDWKMTVLGHNTIRGAAGAAILNAEYLVTNGIDY